MFCIAHAFSEPLPQLRVKTAIYLGPIHSASAENPIAVR